MAYLILLLLAATVFTLLVMAVVSISRDAVLNIQTEYHKKWENKLRDRDFGKFSKWYYFKNPGLKKVIQKLINDVVVIDAGLGQYKNFFSDEEHFEIYKQQYQKCRKDLIHKQANLDAIKGAVSNKFSDPVEQKMYQEFYIKHTVEINQRDSLSPWDDSGISRTSVTIEDFETVFVKNKRQNKADYK